MCLSHIFIVRFPEDPLGCFILAILLVSLDIDMSKVLKLNHLSCSLGLHLLMFLPTCILHDLLCLFLTRHVVVITLRCLADHVSNTRL